MCQTTFVEKEKGPWVEAAKFELQTLLLVGCPSLQKLRPIGLVLPCVKSRFNFSGQSDSGPVY